MQLDLFATDIDEKIHEIFIEDLKRGSGFVDGKIRIYDFFDQKLTKSETIKLLKNEYGVGGRSSLASSDGYSQWHDANGIKITIATRESKQYTWSQVYDATFMLIETGQYLEN